MYLFRQQSSTLSSGCCSSWSVSLKLERGSNTHTRLVTPDAAVQTWVCCKHSSVSRQAARQQTTCLEASLPTDAQGGITGSLIATIARCCVQHLPPDIQLFGPAQALLHGHPSPEQLLPLVVTSGSNTTSTCAALSASRQQPAHGAKIQCTTASCSARWNAPCKQSSPHSLDHHSSHCQISSSRRRRAEMVCRRCSTHTLTRVCSACAHSDSITSSPGPIWPVSSTATTTKHTAKHQRALKNALIASTTASLTLQLLRQQAAHKHPAAPKLYRPQNLNPSSPEGFRCLSQRVLAVGPLLLICRCNEQQRDVALGGAGAVAVGAQCAVWRI